MEILVCVRRVPDTSENEIELNTAGNDIERDDLVYSINEPDNYAVEEALQIVAGKSSVTGPLLAGIGACSGSAAGSNSASGAATPGNSHASWSAKAIV